MTSQPTSECTTQGCQGWFDWWCTRCLGTIIGNWTVSSGKHLSFSSMLHTPKKWNDMNIQTNLTSSCRIKMPFAIEWWSLMIIFVGQMFLCFACISPKKHEIKSVETVQFRASLLKTIWTSTTKNTSNKPDRNHYSPQITWNPMDSVFFLIVLA